MANVSKLMVLTMRLDDNNLHHCHFTTSDKLTTQTTEELDIMKGQIAEKEERINIKEKYVRVGRVLNLSYM